MKANLTDKSAETEIRSLLDGGTPNENDYGKWNTHVTLLHDAHKKDGPQGVRKAYNHLVNQYPALHDLLASDTNNNDDENVSSFIELPKLAQLPEHLANGACPWLDRYVAFSRTWSPDAYDDFHENVALWLLSTVAARRVKANWGHKTYTNLYIALCARSSLFAKSTTADIASEILYSAGLSYLLAPDDSTPQAFINELTQSTPRNYNSLKGEDKQRIDAKLAFAGQRGWFFDEWGMKLSGMMRENGVMADFRGLLRSFDDCKPQYEYKNISRGSDVVKQPYLALLTSLTPDDLRPFARRGAALWGDGFFTRFSFVTPPMNTPSTNNKLPKQSMNIPVELSKPLHEWHDRLGIPDVTITEQEDKDGNKTGKYDVEVTPLPECVYEVDDDVRDAAHNYRGTLKNIASQLENSDLTGNYIRFATKAMRVALLFASFTGSQSVTMQHWIRAQAIAERWRRNLHNLVDELDHTMPSEQRNQEDKVLRLLQRKADQWLTAREVAQRIHNLSREEASDILDVLAGIEEIEMTKTGKAKKYRFIKCRHVDNVDM